MQAKFHQFTPAELYVSPSEPVSPDAGNPGEVPAAGFRATGCAFLDAFVGNLHHHGLRSGDYHAALLGISRRDMCVTVFILTGMTYTDFTTAYVLLMAKDLLKAKKKDLGKIALRLGFESYSGFYRFVRRNMKGKPSWL